MKYSLSFTTDDKLRIRKWGKEITEFTGKSPSMVLGLKYYEVLPRIFIDGVDAVSRAIEGKKPLTIREYPVNCFSGRLKADIRIDPVNDVSGTVSAAKVVVRIHSFCNALERFQHSKRLIDIGKIASTLAHGVRNPLNAIKGSVVYLGEKYSGEPTLVEFTELMEKEISRLDNFISKFLSTSLSEAVPAAADVNSMLKKVEVLISLQAKAGKVEYSFEYGDVPEVKVNSFQLEQAILNIVNNSLEAMNGGGRLIVRSMFDSNGDQGFAVVEVSDTGPGISSGGVDGSITPAPRENGKGFGLFLTREILQSSGGNLEIKSRHDSGTTVRLYLPVNVDSRLEHER